MKIKKTDKINNDPQIPKKIFLILKLKTKWTSERNEIIKKVYPDGVCLVKNETPNIIGRMNHHSLELVFNANIKHKIAIADKYDDWWSTYGVPEDGYAKKDKNKEYKKQ